MTRTAFTAGSVLLLASLVNFLDYNEYPVLRPEVALVIAALLAIAAAMAFFYAGQRQWGRSVLEGLLAFIFVDLNTDSLPLALAVGAAVALVTWWRRISVLPAMIVIGAVIAVTTAIGIGSSHSWIEEKTAPHGGAQAGAGKPAILHLILDEHIGVEGLPQEDSDARRLQEELREFYLSRGFALYGGAYSEHMRTENSIPSMLNYGTRLAREADPRHAVVGPTLYLTSLVKDGYKLTVVQSDYANYCSGAAFHRCLTYDSSSLRPTLPLPMPVIERAEIIAWKFASLSDFLKRLGNAWDAAAISMRQMGWPALKQASFWNRTISSTASAIGAFDMVTGQLRNARAGEAYFVHLLLPHYPFIFDSNCRLLPWSEWEKRKSLTSLKSRRHAYYKQVRCTSQRVDSALDAFMRSPAGKEGIVIIHGDHGSRLTRVDPMQANDGLFSDDDMVATFSTLFAARAPGLTPGYSSDRVPIRVLLQEFAGSGFSKLALNHSTPAPTVYLDNQDWRPVRRVALPESWTRGVDPPVTGH